MTLARTLDLVRGLRRRDEATPVVLMGYFNRSGATARSASSTTRAAGVDGLIVVDLPPEEDDELCVPAPAAACVHPPSRRPPTTAPAQGARNAGGFLYYVSITGITGTRADRRAGRSRGRAAAPAHALPVAVGFGIRTPAQAAAIAGSPMPR